MKTRTDTAICSDTLCSGYIADVLDKDYNALFNYWLFELFRVQSAPEVFYVSPNFHLVVNVVNISK